ncbi:MAG: hypothetical protein K6C94_06995 [Candidatus Gastranaerophilales bacterium]|nr:hypothetical protein [Candidatus Gastranaerophilales bacterium]
MTENNNDFQQNTVLSEKEKTENQQTTDSVSQQPTEKQLNQIARLHKECAKYRTALNTSNSEKAELEKLFNNLKADYASISKQNYDQSIITKLEKAGCLKPSLVLKDIPEDCQNVDEFVQEYQQNNPFLFKKPQTRHGYTFKNGKASNYTASQQMNNYIRSALGR